MSFTASLTVQKVALALILLGGVILAPVFTVQILEGNPLPFLITMGILVSVFFLTVVGRQCWILMPAFLGLNGRLNFLPANISMVEFAILVSLALILYEAVFENKLPESLGPPWFWVPSVLFLSIIAYHWIRSGDIGLRLFGGENFGGRKLPNMFRKRRFRVFRKRNKTFGQFRERWKTNERTRSQFSFEGRQSVVVGRRSSTTSAHCSTWCRRGNRSPACGKSRGRRGSTPLRRVRARAR